MKQVFKRRKSVVGIAVLAVGMIAGGVAYASVPDSAGVIHGCYAKKNGTLRVIDTATKSQKCGTNELAVNWNQTGPKGATGAKGVTGAKGAAGPAGPAGKDGLATYSSGGGVGSNRIPADGQDHMLARVTVQVDKTGSQVIQFQATAVLGTDSDSGAGNLLVSPCFSDALNTEPVPITWLRNISIGAHERIPVTVGFMLKATPGVSEETVGLCGRTSTDPNWSSLDGIASGAAFNSSYAAG
jgi:hypothetical protein